ncbi:MAG: UDP-N-acetylmuramoyl-L-alanyl-D-glutamate--2,6-diaminopimelate ligase [Polyangiaceae bacterium]|nr:UDP-N-acetylmuramoyl-L-alanyl-D-glutamate--2,6-diaminopimelate ligase [Polyangiaceae bacterium]
MESQLALGRLAAALAPLAVHVHGDASVPLRRLVQDSRLVLPGDLFAVRAGGRTSGIEHVAEAARRGAVALLGGPGVAEAAARHGLPALEVDDVRLAIALGAEALAGYPSRSLEVVAITGTNGKTTTSFLVQRMIDACGGRCARLGTLGWSLGADEDASSLTTPEADAVARWAARSRDLGATHLVLEASSHALEQKRLHGTRVAVGVFTNLTQDHLDYHGTLEAYAAAKLRLFTELSPRTAVIHLDDPLGERFAAAATGRVLTVSRRRPASLQAVGAVVDARGLRATIVAPSGELYLESRLVGAHNLENVLAALGVIEALGLDLRRAVDALADAPGVPGRLERCDAPSDDVLVLVDYAHTPDALERALAAVRALGPGRVLCVFGCGGDRDPAKRPLMGAAVGRGADAAWVTSDNPRSEPPRAILDAILPGLTPSGIPYEVEPDRAIAIERAVRAARPGEVVLIAGKGHETYQIVGDETRTFDDRVEARRALARRRGEVG